MSKSKLAVVVTRKLSYGNLGQVCFHQSVVICNLRKAKRRVAQNLPENPCAVNFHWQWFCQLWPTERRPRNLETFEDSLCCKLLWSRSSDNQVLLDAVWCLLTISRFFLVVCVCVYVCMYFTCFSFIKCRSALMRIQDSQWSQWLFIGFALYGIIWE